ncbi:nuclear transport factor 2 family protein [Paratractidigestivibacter faecalis]|uniref:nuclear transport factor 2 family protein n=1 Tax=Paratractidigestivibacter faecalis TaxID=2292441 RepID=UPI003F97FFB1
MSEQGIAMVYDKIHMVLAQGDMVLAISEGTFGGAPTSYYDLWRVADGKIAEHWDVMEAIADKSTWANDSGYNYKFELVLHGCNALCSSWPSSKSGERATKSVTFRVDAASLASSLCDAAEACLKETGETISYPNLELFDVAA